MCIIKLLYIYMDYVIYVHNFLSINCKKDITLLLNFWMKKISIFYILQVVNILLIFWLEFLNDLMIKLAKY